MHVAACFPLVSPLEIQEQEQQEQEKGCLMVMADPSDLGHGKNGRTIKYLRRTGIIFILFNKCLSRLNCVSQSFIVLGSCKSV